jgi:hypothetical protein
MNWPTVAVVAVAAAALVALAYLRVDATYIAALGSLGTVVAGLMRPALAKDQPASQVKP